MRHALRGQRHEQVVEAKAPPSLKAGPALSDVMSLQASIGNAAVGQLFGARERAAVEAPYEVSPETQDAIDAAGAGQALDGSLRSEMEAIAGASLGDVRLHRGGEADTLARSLGATAFTQGRDVFLRSDRDPASAQGRATLAHELSHVAQGSVGRDAVLREPDADKNAPSVVAEMKIKGSKVDGGSSVPGHQGEVDFTSLNMPVSRTSSSGRVGGEDRKEFVELEGMRVSDKASTKLSEAVAKGDVIDEARFVFLKRGPDGSVEDGFTLELKNGLITSYVTGSGDGGVATESLGFSFDKPA